MKLRLKFFIIYIALGVLWILTSDSILISISNDSELVNSIQTYKGFFYVIITGIVFYVLLTYELNKRSILQKKIENANIVLASEIEEKEIALKKAQESDQLKSAFLSNISHEIRTPMNGISGFAELLQMEDIDISSQIEYTSHIKSSTDQLLALMNDILDISKIQSDQLDIIKTTFDLNTLIDQVKEKFINEDKTQKLQNIQVNVVKSFIQHPFIISSDPERIKQVFSKLLKNALCYTDKGSISFGYSLIDSNNINFFVQDSGCGIPTNQLKVIFDTFRQVDFSTTRSFGGLGIGLSICKGIVEKLNGQITVESEINQGSLFRFSIPVLAENELETVNVVENTETTKPWTNKTILIAEDDDLNYLYLHEILKSKGASLIHAKNGQVVLESFIRIEKIDLVLMDLCMPVLDGFETFEQLRIIYGNVPVIAQTAYADQTQQQKCLNHGFDAFISKPIDRKLLFEMIDKVFTNSN